MPKARSRKSGKQPPWNWAEALLIGGLALIGTDIVLGVLLAVVSGLLKNSPLGLPDITSLVKSESITFNFVFYVISRLLGLGLIIYFIHRRAISLRQFGFKAFKPFPALKYLLVAAGLLLTATITVFFYPAANRP